MSSSKSDHPHLIAENRYAESRAISYLVNNITLQMPTLNRPDFLAMEQTEDDIAVMRRAHEDGAVFEWPLTEVPVSEE
jgi:hypothetical protein